MCVERVGYGLRFLPFPTARLFLFVLSGRWNTLAMHFLFPFFALFFWFFGTQAVLVNVTIDDTTGDSLTGAPVIYTPPDAWNSGPAGCHNCLVDPDVQELSGGTWHDSTFSVDGSSNVHPNVPLTASVSFNGSAVYVFCSLSNSAVAPDGDSDMTFFIDGVVVGTFTRRADGGAGFDYGVPVFAHTVTPGQHTLTLQNGHQNGYQSLTILDSIVYSSVRLPCYQDLRSHAQVRRRARPPRHRAFHYPRPLQRHACRRGRPRRRPAPLSPRARLLPLPPPPPPSGRLCTLHAQGRRARLPRVPWPDAGFHARAVHRVAAYRIRGRGRKRKLVGGPRPEAPRRYCHAPPVRRPRPHAGRAAAPAAVGAHRLGDTYLNFTSVLILVSFLLISFVFL
ncbi:hypothetical protein DFH07DRAFT_259786 [Mycena maculata]|uniref:Uncharacterized protein n=1 Tax=Mycena maculata TaxID=230809 RepID=A0AAD7JSG0_9AGAR|nr:hypothetical protein DFH07DRAFT_259786 [Mycena maculata]